MEYFKELVDVRHRDCSQFAATTPAALHFQSQARKLDSCHIELSRMLQEQTAKCTKLTTKVSSRTVITRRQNSTKTRSWKSSTLNTFNLSVGFSTANRYLKRYATDLKTC